MNKWLLCHEFQFKFHKFCASTWEPLAEAPRDPDSEVCGPALVHAICFLFSYCLWAFHPLNFPRIFQLPPPTAHLRVKSRGCRHFSFPLFSLQPFAFVYLRHMHNLMQIMHLFRFVSFHFTSHVALNALSSGDEVVEKKGACQGDICISLYPSDGLTTRPKCTTSFHINVVALTEFVGFAVWQSVCKFMLKKTFSTVERRKIFICKTP